MNALNMLKCKCTDHKWCPIHFIQTSLIKLIYSKMIKEKNGAKHNNGKKVKDKR